MTWQRLRRLSPVSDEEPANGAPAESAPPPRSTPEPAEQPQQASHPDGGAPAARSSAGEAQPADLPAELAPQAMVDTWNRHMRGTPIPQVALLARARQRKLGAITMSLCEGNPSNWLVLCRWLSTDPSRGERNGRGHDGWVAGIDWVLHEDVALRFLERVERARRDGDHPSLEAYPDRPRRVPDRVEQPLDERAPQAPSKPPHGHDRPTRIDEIPINGGTGDRRRQPGKVTKLEPLLPADESRNAGAGD